MNAEAKIALFDVWTVGAFLAGVFWDQDAQRTALVKRGHACWAVNPTNGEVRLVFRGEEGFVR